MAKLTPTKRAAIPDDAEAPEAEAVTTGAAADSEMASMETQAKTEANRDKHPTRIAIRRASDKVHSK